MSESVETQATVEASGCGCGGTPEIPEAQRQNLELSAATSTPVIPVAQIPNPVITSQGVPMPETTPSILLRPTLSKQRKLFLRLWVQGWNSIVLMFLRVLSVGWIAIVGTYS